MRIAVLASIIAVLSGTALAQDASEANPHAAHASHGDAAARSAGTQALVAANDRMMGAMMEKPTGKTDRDFAQMMLQHHKGAVEMARIELQHGTDPELRTLAEAIIAAQEPEIRRLEAWLAEQK
jgi:uncharacterized protein (DUF305 family)